MEAEARVIDPRVAVARWHQKDASRIALGKELDMRPRLCIVAVMVPVDLSLIHISEPTRPY